MIDINLAPWREYLKTRERHMQWLEMMAAMVLAILLLSVLHWFFVDQIQESKNRLAFLKQRLERVNQKMEETKGLSPVIEYQKTPEMNLDFILSHQQRILGFLQQLTQQLPNQANLKQIRLEKNRWKIEGVATAIPTVLPYVEKLKTSFKKITLLDLKQIDGQCYFQLGIEMLS